MRQPLRLNRIWYFLGVLMLLLVAVLSLMPLDTQQINLNDKTAHILIYTLLSGWFSVLAVDRARLFSSAAGLLFYGLLIELLQGMTGYRFAEWRDVIANGGGILLGMLAYPLPLRAVMASIDLRIAQLLQRLGLLPLD